VKTLHIDWSAFLGFLEPWEGLAAPARRFLLDSKPKSVFHGGAVDGLPALLSGGFLKGMADGARVQLSEAFHETHKALRSFARHPLLESPEEQTLREYLREHFTNAERCALDDSVHWDRDARLVERVTSAGHVRGFLGAKDRRAWERERLPRRGWSSEQAWTQAEPLLAGKGAGEDLATLIELLATARDPLPFRALAERLPTLSRARLARALEAGLRYLLLFPALDAGLAPVLMLWPGVAARLTRVPAPPPPSVEPSEDFCLAFRLEDLTQLLVRAAEPLRVKADGWRLFAAVGRELERGLLPLPAWLTHPRLFPENAPGERVREALRLAEVLGLVAHQGRRGRDLSLVTTPAGWKWLDLEPRERLERVLELFRPEPERHGGHHPTEEAPRGAAPEEMLFGALSEGLDELEELEELLAAEDESEDELVPFAAHSAHRSTALSDATLFGSYGSRGLARAAIGAFARLEPGRAVPFRGFLSHHVEASNPFSRESPRLTGCSRYGHPLTEEQLDELWIHGLQRILHVYLLPFGGVRAGLTREGGLTIELNALGRYVLGLADDFTLDTVDSLDAAHPVKAPVRVQPDFEVVFVAASPSHEAAISRFAERRGAGVGVLFRITRESILQAAQARLGADEVLAVLARASATPVPANVEHEIRAWFASCRRLRIEPVHLVRCPDARTAARVLAAAGAGKLEALSETVLVLADPAHKAAVTRACRKVGLFLLEGDAAPTPKRSGARGRPAAADSRG
jgi:hypothetical protein